MNWIEQTAPAFILSHLPAVFLEGLFSQTFQSYPPAIICKGSRGTLLSFLFTSGSFCFDSFVEFYSDTEIPQTQLLLCYVFLLLKMNYICGKAKWSTLGDYFVCGTLGDPKLWQLIYSLWLNVSCDLYGQRIFFIYIIVLLVGESHLHFMKCITGEQQEGPF